MAIVAAGSTLKKCFRKEAHRAAAHWPLGGAPHPLETSVSGVFAAGDIRAGNIKRVAAAVGKGSLSVSFAHLVLHE